MNRKQRRASNREGKRLQSLPWNAFKDVTEEAIEKARMLGNFYAPDKCFQNNKYIVQVKYKVPIKGKFYTRVMTRRSDSEPILSWTDLYRIKNEIFGEEVEAIQFLPKVSELVDVANLYWFFIEEVNK